MAKKKGQIPEYGTVVRKGIRYYRTRITDADGKRVDLYAETCEELYQKEQEARRQVEEAIFRKENPTVAEYCEKWLLMQSAKISPATLRGYTINMNKYIVEPLGSMYLSDVTADDIRLALIPLTTKSAGLYSTVNMLLKCDETGSKGNSCVLIADRGEIVLIDCGVKWSEIMKMMDVHLLNVHSALHLLIKKQYNLS